MDTLTLIRLALAGKWKILLFASVCAISAYLAGLFLVSYEAEGQLIVRPVGSRSLDTEEWSLQGMVYSPYPDILRQEGITYISILRSREVVGRVVDKLGLQKRYEGRDWLILDVIKAPFRFLFYGRLPAVKQTPREQAIERTRKSIRAILISGSSVLQVSAKNNGAVKAHDIVNTLMDTVVSYSTERNSAGARRTRQLMKADLARIQQQKSEAMSKLEAMRTTYGLKSTGTVPEQVAELALKINTLERQIDVTLSELMGVQQQITVLEKSIAEIPEHTRWSYTLDRNPALEALRSKLMTQRLELISAQTDFQPESYQIAWRQRQIDMTSRAIREQLDKLMTRETFQADQNRNQLMLDLIYAKVSAESLPLAIDDLRKRVAGYNQRASELNSIAVDFSELENKLKTLDRTEEKLRSAMSDLEGVINFGPTEFFVLNRPVIPRYPSIHKIPLAFYVFFAFLMGGFVAIFYVLYRDPEAGQTDHTPDTGVS